MLRFDELYHKEIFPKLKEKLNCKNPHQVPRILEVHINMSPGKKIVENSKVMEFVVRDLEAISGQKPIVTKARKSISTFKLREHMPIGCKVTLRRKRMFDFLERLVLIALPRVRDFRGFSTKSFDGKGNFSLGIKEQIVFSEIDYDKIDAVRGLSVTIVTSAQTNEEAMELLKGFHFPFITKQVG